MQNNYPVPLEQGEVATIAYPDPGAGNDVIMLLPNGYRYLIQGVFYDLVTDATATNRLLGLVFSFLSGGAIEEMTSVNATASLTLEVSYLPGRSVGGLIRAPQYPNTLPYPIYMDGNDSILTNIQNLQAGDVLTNPELFVRRWAMQTV